MKERNQTLFVVLLLCIAGLLGAQAFDAPLMLDDEDELRHVQGFGSVWDCFSPDSYGLLRPVKNLLFWFVTRAPASPVTAAHAASLLLFIGATVMVTLWLRRWHPGSLWPAAGAAIWSLSPTLVSTYAWFSCANILVYTIFLLGALCLWEEAHQSVACKRHQRGVVLLLCCALCYVVAFLSYEAAIVLPLLAALQDLARGRKLLSRTSLLFHAPLVLLVTGTLLARWAITGNASPDNPGLAPMSGGQLVSASAYFLADHLLWWAVPFGRQEILGTYVPFTSASPTQLVAAWLLVGLGLGFYVALRGRASRAALGGLWAVAALVPMINLVPLRTGPFADYYLTLSSVGITLVVLEVLRWALRGARRMPAPALVAKAAFWSLVLATVLWRGTATLTSFRWAATWNDPAALLRASIDARTPAYRAQANLARRCMMEGDLDLAERLARLAQAEAPWYALSYNVLGDTTNRRGDHQAARNWYTRAVTNAAADAYTHFALAYTCETWLDDPDTARENYGAVTAAGASNPFRESAFLNLGRLLAMGGDLKGAIALLTRALAEFPRSADIKHNLAIACRQAERRQGSFTHGQEANR